MLTSSRAVEFEDEVGAQAGLDACASRSMRLGPRGVSECAPILFRPARIMTGFWLLPTKWSPP